jgi:hypothetical protein
MLCSFHDVALYDDHIASWNPGMMSHDLKAMKFRLNAFRIVSSGISGATQSPSQDHINYGEVQIASHYTTTLRSHGETNLVPKFLSFFIVSTKGCLPASRLYFPPRHFLFRFAQYADSFPKERLL